MIRYKDNITEFQKGTFADQPVNFAVVYRSSSSSPVNYIRDIVQGYNIEILLSNFNINIFHDRLLNKIPLQKWQMIASEPTGLIDHLHLGKTFMKNKQT